MKNTVWFDYLVYAGIVVTLAFVVRPHSNFAQESLAEIVSEASESATVEETSDFSTLQNQDSEIISSSEATFDSVDEASKEASLVDPSPSPIPSIVLSAQDEVNNRPVTVQIDPQAQHTCSAEVFSKKLERGKDQQFTIETTLSSKANVIRNSVFLGDLPDGIGGRVLPAASKTENKYDILFEADPFSQRGSFNIPIFYSQETIQNEVSTTICQLNLIVE